MSDSTVAAQAFVGTPTEDKSMVGKDADKIQQGSVQKQDEDFYVAATAAMATAETHLANGVRQRWISANQAYNNKHFDGSKYLSKRFRGRTHLFRPKTRSAVRAIMATAAAALFGNPSVVSISAGDEQDPVQKASAAIKQELLNYRLDRASGRNAIPWFVTSMGAAQSAAITGLVASKQYWEYKERTIKRKEIVTKATETDEGLTIIEDVEEQVERTIVERDRPMIKLYPIEQVGRDPAADWTDQTSGSFLFLSEPITVDDLQNLMKQPGPVKWRELGQEELSKSVANYEAGAVRRSREEGQDRLDRARPVKGHDLTWIHEMFIRLDGEEWHYWVLGDSQILSEPMPLEDAYPHLEGQRPVVIGMGSLDAFTVNPMSPVESWQPMQQEMNDIVNLRLDNLKQNMSPLTKVVRGKRVSVQAIQNRSADSILYLDKLDDVEFDRPPGFGAEAYAETDRINADFDDLAGKFSGSSVSTNRAMNETVGGMNLLNQSAMTMSEFDLTVFLESWVEPALRQVLKLEEYYESDETVLALCSKKAKVLQKYGVDENTDDLLDREVTCRVNAGRGASDPNQALQRFGGAVKMFVDVTGEAGLARLNVEEVGDEIFGKAGHKDGERFVKRDDEMQDPKLQEAQQMIQQLQQQLETKQLENQAKVEVANINANARLSEQQLENQTDLQIAQLKAQQDERNQQRDMGMRVMEKMFVEPGKEQQSSPAQQPRKQPQTIEHEPMPAQPPVPAPQVDQQQMFMQAQMQIAQQQLQASKSMAQSMAALTQQLAMAAQMMMQPKETILIRDEEGRPVSSRQVPVAPEPQQIQAQQAGLGGLEAML